MLKFMRSKRGLVDLARARAEHRNHISKPDHYYETYERFFAPLRSKPVTVFEVGVYRGESTKVLADYFSAGRIVGIDLHLPAIDLTAFDNIVLAQGSQSDADLLNGLAKQHAPSGIDIVIDDASHEGALSLATFRILFPLVKPGGLYAVEDYGTGYWPDRTDGAAYAAPREEGHRITSHDFGMVGFVKSLVDHVAGDAKNAQKPSDVAAMHVLPGIVMLEKR